MARLSFVSALSISRLLALARIHPGWQMKYWVMYVYHLKYAKT